MKTIKISKAARPLAEYVRELNEDIMVLTDGNRPVAAIVPLRGVDQESLLLSGHPEFVDLIARSRAEFAAGQTLSLGEMKRAVLTRRQANKSSQGTAKKRGRSNA